MAQLPFSSRLLSSLAVVGSLCMAGGIYSRCSSEVSEESSEKKSPSTSGNCLSSFPENRFQILGDGTLPLPSRLPFVPSWIKDDKEALDRLIADKVGAPYRDYFYCLWTDQKQLKEGLEILNKRVLDKLPVKTVSVPTFVEGMEGLDTTVEIHLDFIRKTIEQEVFHESPSILLYQNITNAKPARATLEPRGEDVPETGQPIEYEGHYYLNLGTKHVARWPLTTQKIEKDKEWWDFKAGKWVKCLSY